MNKLEDDKMAKLLKVFKDLGIETHVVMFRDPDTNRSIVTSGGELPWRVGALQLHLTDLSREWINMD